MPDSLEIQVAQRGVIVLPKSLRDKYNLKPGDSITIIDLDGTLVLTPGRSKIDALADDIRQALTERGETMESMLRALREERERYANGD
jgi:AbrB family looped-hinge helix DNA binding protein